MTAAGERLHIAQPSLSLHVRQLEESLGAKLVTRSAKGVVLTEQGQILLARARDILQMIERTEEDVRASYGNVTGSVAFGMPSSAALVMGVPLAETVRLAAPGVNLRIAEAMSGSILDWVTTGELDLAVLYDVAGIRQLSLRPMLTEIAHFFSAPDSWPLKSEPGVPVSLKEIARLDLFLPSRAHGLRKLIDSVARSNGVTISPVLEIDSLANIKALVSRASGYSILMPAAAHEALAAGNLVCSPICDPLIERKVYLARNPEKTMTRACDLVERNAISVVEDLLARDLWYGGKRIER